MWGRRIMTTEWMQASARPAQALINEIAPYYGAEPLFDPESGQRVDRAPNPCQPRANPCAGANPCAPKE